MTEAVCVDWANGARTDLSRSSSSWPNVHLLTSSGSSTYICLEYKTIICHPEVCIGTVGLYTNCDRISITTGLYGRNTCWGDIQREELAQLK